MPTPLPWITDRLPTAVDGDTDGEVVVQRTSKSFYFYLHWSCVKPGMAWRRSFYWIFPLLDDELTIAPTPMPTPSTPIPLPWITDRLPTRADGDEDGDVIILIPGIRAWCRSYWGGVEPGQPWLAFAPPATPSTSEPTPSTPTPLTRRIMSVAEVDGTAIAVADDGTAWYLSANWASWTQLPALPKSED